MATVEGMFEKLDYPVDVIWLDIDHTDGMRYFTVSFRSILFIINLNSRLIDHIYLILSIFFNAF